MNTTVIGEEPKEKKMAVEKSQAQLGLVVLLGGLEELSFCFVHPKMRFNAAVQC